MTPIMRLLILLASPLIGCAVLWGAESSRPVPANAAAGNALRTYKPPVRGAPKRRVDAGTRGGQESGMALYVLAPDHVGWTVREQPALFWYVSRPVGIKLEFTLIDNLQAAPLVEAPLAQDSSSPLQRIDLARFNARLALNVDYQWSVAAVPDAVNRSKDIVASGAIRRVAASPELAKQLSSTGTNAWHVYAENGIWYEALSVLSDSITANSDDQTLRRHRAALLREVELPDAAQSDEQFKKH